MADIKIDTSAKTVKNEKTKKQEESLKKAKEAKEKAAKDAEKERIKAAEKKEKERLEREKQKEEKELAAKREEEEKAKKNSEGAAALVGSLAAAATEGINVYKKNKKKKSGKGSFWIGALVGLLVGAAIMLLIGTSSKWMLFGTNQTTVTTADEVLETGIIGYTAVDFQDAVLGEASQHQELIVMEQPVEIAATITKAGLANLAVFSKIKTITYFGTGVYTVDMAGIDAEHIRVDLDAKQVTVLIPHSCLQYVNADLDKTEFEDTQKGLLAFGELKLKTEDQNRLLQAVNSSLEEKLTEKEQYRLADEFAVMSTWQMFQPLITAVSPEFTVEIGFDETTENRSTVKE